MIAEIVNLLRIGLEEIVINRKVIHDVTVKSWVTLVC